jgi:putative oxidoreductase
MKTPQQLIRFVASTNTKALDTALLLFRIATALMAVHGWSKFANFYEGIDDWPDPLHVGVVTSKALTVFAELFCALLVAVGLFTRAALIPLIFCMIVIVFIIHAGDPFEDIEHGLLYLLAYIALFLTGPGKYSIDALMQRKA